MKLTTQDLRKMIDEADKEEALDITATYIKIVAHSLINMQEERDERRNRLPRIRFINFDKHLVLGPERRILTREEAAEGHPGALFPKGWMLFIENLYSRGYAIADKVVKRNE